MSQEFNRVSVVKIDAPVGNMTPKPLFQRIILECGKNYFERDNEEKLLKKVVGLFQKCRTKVLIIDEIEHMTKEELKRRVVELTNVTEGVPIICASCQPITWVGIDLERQGRWNDVLLLYPYTGDRIRELLSFIDILLPFTEESHLGKYEIEITKNNKTEKIDGPAKLIEAWTGGVLRDIMMLIIDASISAIDADEKYISPIRLQQTWAGIQNSPIVDVFELFKAHKLA